MLFPLLSRHLSEHIFLFELVDTARRVKCKVLLLVVNNKKVAENYKISHRGGGKSHSCTLISVYVWTMSECNFHLKGLKSTKSHWNHVLFKFNSSSDANVPDVQRLPTRAWPNVARTSGKTFNFHRHATFRFNLISFTAAGCEIFNIERCHSSLTCSTTLSFKQNRENSSLDGWGLERWR